MVSRKTIAILDLRNVGHKKPVRPTRLEAAMIEALAVANGLFTVNLAGQNSNHFFILILKAIGPFGGCATLIHPVN
jgi:hypothetical protein